eukprot:261745_1
MSKLSEDDEDSMDETTCTICGDSNTYEDDTLMDCSNCDVIFHQSCYGLQNKTIDINQPFTCFYCIFKKEVKHELNKNKSKIKENKTCELCSKPKNELALTTIDTNNNQNKHLKWVHVICAYSFECKCNCNKSKQPSKVIVNLDNIKYNKIGTCFICNSSKGYKIKCSHPNCTSKIHPSCARIEIDN